jgi:hypothetical protein
MSGTGCWGAGLAAGDGLVFGAGLLGRGAGCSGGEGLAGRIGPNLGGTLSGAEECAGACGDGDGRVGCTLRAGKGGRGVLD